ncbi:MA3 domain protein [Gregarina niphandrodes]|uniref:MA3 domain protein n=1 Tax=Gregarina niphandrodes TaxID=110365 RepID=A0A023AXG8_GRENI|nr:MA3 domain protein [Gregarina niphandrodes]EZG43153.1 MA3 domain protein [Gregarina niphandrodes]|eukprot:XP_011133594.1 MA3 domain protein [Gregarina niphandrodes]
MSSEAPASEAAPTGCDSVGVPAGSSVPVLKSTLSVGESLLPDRSEQGASSLAYYTKCVDSAVHDYLCESLKASEVIEKVRALDTPIFADVFVLRSIQHVIPMGEAKQADVAQLLTIAYDSRIFSRQQCTRAFEKLLQQAVGFKQAVDGSIEEALFAFFTAAADDGWVEPSFLSKLPEYFVKNLPPLIRDADPVLAYNEERLRKYKQACVQVVEEALAEGSSDTVVDFLQTNAGQNATKGAQACGSNPASGAPGGMPPPPPATVIVPPITNELIKHEFVRRLLANGLSSNSPTEREMVSKMLSELYGLYLSPDDVQLGVVRLLASLSDLVLDCPDASTSLSKFISLPLDDIGPPRPGPEVLKDLDVH